MRTELDRKLEVTDLADRRLQLAAQELALQLVGWIGSPGPACSQGCPSFVPVPVWDAMQRFKTARGTADLLWLEVATQIERNRENGVRTGQRQSE